MCACAYPSASLSVYLCEVMFKGVLYTLTTLCVFLFSQGEALIYLDYRLNQSYYETYCLNKDKPELKCEGKCQMAEQQSQDGESRLGLTKLSLEFHYVLSEPSYALVEEGVFKSIQVVTQHPSQRIFTQDHTPICEPPEAVI